MYLVASVCFQRVIKFLPERDYVTFGSLLPRIRLSFVVCNVRQYFLAILYLSHPLTSVQKFTEIVSGEPVRRER